jgi:apolipoprotein N-acyltransferase
VSFAILCGGLCAVLECPGSSAEFFIPRISFVAVAFITINAQMCYPGDPAPPRAWEGIDTSFGRIAHGLTSPLFEYTAAEWIQERARSSRAEVIVFPETVVPRWTAATELLWAQSLLDLSENGKTILVGAELPLLSSCPGNSSERLRRYDFSAAVAVLRSGLPEVPRRCAPVATFDHPEIDAYQNSIVIRGAQQATFIQRIPVPVGMWHPFGKDGVPLNLSAPGVVRIKNQRAAILICYEQLLTWPVLSSMLEHPNILVAVANDYWVSGTSIPRYQTNAIQSWARLFFLPRISATNL